MFRHTLFQEKPSIPALFLIHERKLTESHRVLFQTAGVRIASLKMRSPCLVTNREKAIVNAALAELPTIHLVQCWNHVLRDIRFWLRKHGAPATDITAYIEDASYLFHSSSAEEYKERLKACCERWDSVFEAYYLKEIHPIVPQFIGRWILEKHNIYNPYSGVTTNQSESLNKVIKDFQSWKEAPLDCLVLVLY